MWDNVIESVQQLKDDDGTATRGCILAHCMGLGKTLSVSDSHCLSQSFHVVFHAP